MIEQRTLAVFDDQQIESRERNLQTFIEHAIANEEEKRKKHDAEMNVVIRQKVFMSFIGKSSSFFNLH
jgi:hypothetical protein